MRKRALNVWCALFVGHLAAAALAAPVPAFADTPLSTNANRTPDAAPGVDPIPRAPKSTDGAIVLPSAPAVATNLGPESMKRHDDCLAKAEKSPKEAYEDGLVWRAEGGGALALHCVARAQLNLGDYNLAAERLELVASMREVNIPAMRAVFYTEAGHAFLLAHRTEDAKRNFNSAIEIAPADPELRLDRAEALMLAGDWKGAAADMDESLKLRPNNPEALRMRGEAKLSLREFDAAAADADAALKADPSYVPALVLRGKVREAKAGRNTTQ